MEIRASGGGIGDEKCSRVGISLVMERKVRGEEVWEARE